MKKTFYLGSGDQGTFIGLMNDGYAASTGKFLNHDGVWADRYPELHKVFFNSRRWALQVLRKIEGKVVPLKTKPRGFETFEMLVQK